VRHAHHRHHRPGSVYCVPELTVGAAGSRRKGVAPAGTCQTCTSVLCMFPSVHDCPIAREPLFPPPAAPHPLVPLFPCSLVPVSPTGQVVLQGLPVGWSIPSQGWTSTSATNYCTDAKLILKADRNPEQISYQLVRKRTGAVVWSGGPTSLQDDDGGGYGYYYGYGCVLGARVTIAVGAWACFKGWGYVCGRAGGGG
jgi:hypothetical protein